jgi:hypothetical protein
MAIVLSALPRITTSVLNILRLLSWIPLWYVPLVINTSRSFPHSWLITYFETILTRWVSLVNQEMLTIPEFTPVSSEVRVTRSLIFCTFSVGNVLLRFCRFWLPLWYLQTFLSNCSDTMYFSEWHLGKCIDTGNTMIRLNMSSVKYLCIVVSNSTWLWATRCVT